MTCYGPLYYRGTVDCNGSVDASQLQIIRSRRMDQGAVVLIQLPFSGRLVEAKVDDDLRTATITRDDKGNPALIAFIEYDEEAGAWVAAAFANVQAIARVDFT